MYSTQPDRHDARLLCESDVVTTDSLRFGYLLAHMALQMPEPEFRITFRESIEALVKRGAFGAADTLIDVFARNGRHRLHELETDDVRPILLKGTELQCLLDHTTEAMELFRRSPQMDPETGEDASGDILDYEPELDDEQEVAG